MQYDTGKHCVFYHRYHIVWSTKYRYKVLTGRVRLRVYDVRGRYVCTLEDGWREAGEHTAVWNPSLSLQQRLPAGVYIYRLEAPQFTSTRRMVYIP